MKNLTLLLTILLITSTYCISQSNNIDTQKSTIKWESKKIGGSHNGFVNIKSGTLNIKDNTIINGEFIINMTSISNTDIENKEFNAKLVNHLKSDDFFGVENHPTSTLTITKASPFDNNKAKISGNLTIKGKSLPITFDVIKNNNAYRTKLTIDRSKYDIKYGSKSFFDNLGDKVIHDDFTLEVELVIK